MGRYLMKFIEHETADLLKRIILREAQALEEKGALDKADFICLEKLTKSYATLAADTRESIKAGVLGKMSDAELKAIADS
jgi:hypothetical protein